MKKFTAILACLLISIFVIVGCGKKNEPAEAVIDPDVVGTWEEHYLDSGYTFNEDGTGYDSFWNLSFTYTADNGTLKTKYDSDLYGTAEYKYSVSGNELTMTRIADDADTFVYEKQSSGGSSAKPAATEAPESTSAAEAEEDTTSEE